MANGQIDTLDLESPCPADIEDLGSTERRRHCTLCSKDVHNLSAMTRAEATTLLDRDEDICVAYETNDNVVQFQSDRPSRRTPRMLSVLSAIGLGITTQSGCDLLNEPEAKNKRGVKDKLADQMKGLFIDQSQKRPKTRKFRGKMKSRKSAKRSKQVQARIEKAAREAAERAARAGSVATVELNPDICYEVEVPDTGQ